MAYWYADSPDAERWQPLKADTLADAIAEARHVDGGEISEGSPFNIAVADKQPWRFDCFDRIDEEFDNSNEELGDGDGDPPSVDAGLCVHGSSAKPALLKHLEAALESWVRENGNPSAWSLNFTEAHDVPATAEWHAAQQAAGEA